MEVVCDGLRFPEGPVALADGSVIVVEAQGQALTRITPDGRKEVLIETGGGPNGAAVGPDGAIWIANNGGAFFYADTYQGGYIQRFDPATGVLETVYDACEGVRLIAPNDLVFDRQGGLWFTDHGGQNGITVFDVDGTMALIPCPDPITTNICFGGADMRDAWITGSAGGRLYKTRWPRPGLRLNFG